MPGQGDAFPSTLTANARPGCDLSWRGADPVGAAGSYALALFTDPAGTTPALDARSGQPLVSTFVADPEPHADLPPAYLAAATTLYLRVTRSGTPPPDQLTLFCRADLPASAQVTGSSAPTPGDARGALSVGAYDWADGQAESYSSEGPTDDGRRKPDLSAPTNVRHHRRLLHRHLVRHAPRGRRRRAAVERGRRRRRPGYHGEPRGGAAGAALDAGRPGWARCSAPAAPAST